MPTIMHDDCDNKDDEKDEKVRDDDYDITHL